MTARLLVCSVLLACLGCAGPALVSRDVQNEPALLIRLDAYADPAGVAEVKNDHPAVWADGDLEAMLGRLLVEERAGLLEKVPPPEPVFSPDEARLLAPGVRRAFQMAGPPEWIVFAVARQAGGGQTVTSGGLFLKDQLLHVVIANHREPVASGSDGLKQVRAHPLRALKRTGKTLGFNPPKAVVSSAESWPAGYGGTPAAALVLDLPTFMASTTLPAPTAPAGDGDLKAQVERLREEIERLKEKLEDQEVEIARLKARLGESDGAQRKPPKKSR
ncbi:MAG: hypothetical protein AB1411_01180 [Nitrospirota bacterium]